MFIETNDLSSAVESSLFRYQRAAAVIEFSDAVWLCVK